jgi:Lon protease-like protein
MSTSIPMFPLSILPLPGEMVPLHIFEPRYKQLLQDAETNDISFGIFFNNTINEEKVGSLMKLETVLKRYPTGESDIIVKCYDLFTLDKLSRTYKSKLYPGGEVQFWNESVTEPVNAELETLFAEYLKRRNIKRNVVIDNIFGIAQELNLELNERYQLVTSLGDMRERFLKNQLTYKVKLLQHEEKSKDVYHLN